MEFNIDTNGNQRQMNLKGRLTFSDHELFREITGSLKEPGPSACQIKGDSTITVQVVATCFPNLHIYIQDAVSYIIQSVVV